MISLYHSTWKKFDNILSILWILLHYNSVLSFLKNETKNGIGEKVESKKLSSNIL